MRQKASYKNILIIRTDRIGDVILSTPVIQAARQASPHSRIIFMTRPYTKDIVIGNPYLDEVLIYDKDRAHKSVLATILFAFKLRKYKFDLALVLHSTTRVNWVAFLAGIPRRAGYDRKAGCLLTDRLPYVKPHGLKHEMEYTLDIARLAGITCDSQNLSPYIPISRDAEYAVSSFLKNSGVTEKDALFCVSPGSGCISRRWPAQRFAEASDKIMDNAGCKAIILAAEGDLELANIVRDNMRHKAIMAENFTIPQAAALLKLCRFFISTDTGPSHIAAAAGTPCITIFGRKQPGLSPVRWKPLGKDVAVLHKDAGCMECLAHRCAKHFACVGAVTVDEVLNAAKKFL